MPVTGGMNPKEENTLRSHAEVAAIMTAKGFKLSRSRVQQIEAEALRKIRVELQRLFEVRGRV